MTLLELQLRDDPSSVRLARGAAERALVGVCDAQHRADVLTVISELVTNAVRHTAGGCTLVLLHDSDQIVVEVRDSDTRASRSAGDNHDADLGRGLGVVQSLAQRWGIDRIVEGKCVWVEVSLDSTTASC